MACETPFRDDSEQRLLYKIASCCFSGGGSGGAGVSSFNGRTGAVTLTPGDVSGVADDLYVNETGDSMTGALSINNGVLVANDPALELSQTWNNAAETFTGLLSNVTSTAAGANSLLFDFQLGGSSVLNLQATGRFLLNGRAAFINTGSVGHILNTTDALNTAVVNVLTVGHSLSAGAGAAGLGARIDVVGASATVADQSLLRIDSSWIDPIQATRTSAANFILPVSGTLVSHLTLTNNQAQLRDGTAALPSITFQSDPDTGIYRTGANSIGFSASGAVVLTVYSFGAELPVAGSFFWTGSSVIGAPSNGVIRLSNAAGTDFERLQFGGTTAAFPSIKRNGAGLDFRLADDSGYAAITTAAITMSTAAPLSITSGANQRAGNLTLVGGTLTVANTSVTANTIILLTRKTAGGTIGTAISYTVIAATSFTVTSDSALDTSTFSYLIIEVP